MSAAAARATRGMREVSDAIAELREADIMLKGFIDSQPIAAETRKPPNLENARLAYRVDEAAKLLGVHRRTIERWIDDGTLKGFKVVGARLIEAESVKALFEPRECRGRGRFPTRLTASVRID
jgi:excisionase family DNA binding protein